MKSIGLSKDEVVDSILQLTDDGYIEDTINFLKGRIKTVFRSPKMIDSADFIDMLDEEQMNTPAKVEFYVNLFSLAAVLVHYNDKDMVTMRIEDRVSWIEENVPTVIFRIILPKALEFHTKLDILSSEEVADFF
jgi:hypothetical protein